MRLNPLWKTAGANTLLSLKSDKKLCENPFWNTQPEWGYWKLDHTASSEMCPSGGKLALFVLVNFNFRNCCVIFFIHVFHTHGSLCQLVHLLCVLSSMELLARSLLTLLSVLGGAGLIVWALWRWWLNPWWTWGSWRPLPTWKTPTAPLMTERDRAHPASRSPWYAWTYI